MLPIVQLDSPRPYFDDWTASAVNTAPLMLPPRNLLQVQNLHPIRQLRSVGFRNDREPCIISLRRGSSQFGSSVFEAKNQKYSSSNNSMV